MVTFFFRSIVVRILDLKAPLQLMQKSYLFSEQIGMLLANAIKNIGYMYTVLFLTTGKSDIYQYKKFR